MGAGAVFAGASILQAGSGIMSSISDYRTGRQQANQYKLQSQQLELQKDIITDQYRTQRNQLQGTAIARAGHSGVKVSGSVAQSISTSLTEMGMEESYKKFNINMELNNIRYKQGMANISSKNALVQNMSKTAISALGNYATYQQFWGAPVKDVTGAAKTGGNVIFTNASYEG